MNLSLNRKNTELGFAKLLVHNKICLVNDVTRKVSDVGAVPAKSTNGNKQYI